jgi:hypothetical protein
MYFCSNDYVMKISFRHMMPPLLLATVVSVVFVIYCDLVTAVECAYYASPDGEGNGLSPSSPFRIGNFWSVAAPGKTLCLLDGVYRDSTNPPDHLNGTASARITVRALNDGAARIDGGGTRIPIQLKNNDYFLIEGLNVHNSICNVVQIGTGANNNILRRIVAWDAKNNKNCMIWGVNNNTGNLLEDVAGFGTGRKIFQNYKATGTIIRRAWGRWENSTMIGPKSTFNLAYGGSDQICENCIGTWDGTAVNQPQAIFRSGPSAPGSVPASNAWYHGSIAYLTDIQKSNLGRVIFFSELTSGGFKDVVVYLSSNHVSKRPFVFATGRLGPCTRCVLTNTTTIGHAGSKISTGLAVKNHVAADTVEAAPSIWDATDSQGARVCKRYVNGSLTNQPLWPWPMNQRIIDAMTVAGKIPVDVTKTMEEIFGPIPRVCRSDSESAVR